MLLYPAMMVTTLMYFGEHYFVDGLAGLAVVGVSFLLWNRIERRWERRRAEPNQASPDAVRRGARRRGRWPASEQPGVRATVDV